MSELLDQKNHRDELSKKASESGKQLLEESRLLEEKFREQGERRRREQQELQKQQLLEMKQAENLLMKKAKDLRKGSCATETDENLPNDAETKWKKGFLARLLSRH